LRDNEVLLKKITKIEDYKDKVKELYESGKSGYEIAHILCVGESTINRYLKKMGLNTTTKSKRRTDCIKNHIEKIVDLYKGGIGCYTIAKQFNCDESSVNRLLHENNVAIDNVKLYNVDSTFFEKIDTEEKAYILG
jgi:transposase-like protein